MNPLLPKAKVVIKAILNVTFDLVLIEMVDTREEKFSLSEGGIAIPKEIQDKIKGQVDAINQVAKVVNMGPVAFRTHYEYGNLPVAIGDYVYVPKYCGDQHTINGKSYKWVKDTDIWSKIEIEED